MVPGDTMSTSSVVSSACVVPMSYTKYLVMTLLPDNVMKSIRVIQLDYHVLERREYPTVVFNNGHKVTLDIDPPTFAAACIMVHDL